VRPCCPDEDTDSFRQFQQCMLRLKERKGVPFWSVNEILLKDRTVICSYLQRRVRLLNSARLKKCRILTGRCAMRRHRRQQHSASTTTTAHHIIKAGHEQPADDDEPDDEEEWAGVRPTAAISSKNAPQKCFLSHFSVHWKPGMKVYR
jgi:hypothetical protein